MVNYLANLQIPSIFNVPSELHTKQQIPCKICDAGYIVWAIGLVIGVVAKGQDPCGADFRFQR